jgi:hypothetical protein
MINDPLDVFLKDFSENETLVFEWETNSSPNSVAVKAIFDNSFFDSSIGETVLDTTSPRITCKASSVTTLPREALVTIRGKRYSVTQIEPDGTGFATVMLAHE